MKIDFYGLINAMEDHTGYNNFYLDKETGEFPFISQFLGEDESPLTSKMLEDNPDRYCHVEPLSSRDGYRIMEDFMFDLPDGEDKKILERALEWKKPFSNFRAALSDMPEVQAAWRTHHDVRMRKLALEWLTFHGITDFEEE